MSARDSARPAPAMAQTARTTTHARVHPSGLPNTVRPTSGAGTTRTTCNARVLGGGGTIASDGIVVDAMVDGGSVCSGSDGAGGTVVAPAASASSKRTRRPQAWQLADARQATKSMSAPQSGQRRRAAIMSPQKWPVGQQLGMLGKHPCQGSARCETADVSPVADGACKGGIGHREDPAEELQTHEEPDYRPRG
jgi:hypothetical protein